MTASEISASLAPVQVESQAPSETSSFSRRVAVLFRLLRSISLVWKVIIYSFLVGITVITFLQHPEFLREPRGWGIIALALVLGLWYNFGLLWVVCGNSARYYARLDSGELPHLHWRGFLYWASLLGLVTALSLLDHNFVWMFWAVYGLNFAIFPFPEVFVTLIPTIVILMVANGALPSGSTPMDILNFVGELGGLTIYSLIAYLPFMLIKARIHREKVFADLEESHQELELAHRRLEAAHHRLAEAGEREREIAVLRERGRLARDMHDTLGHALVLANVKLEAALRLRAVDPTRADHEIIATQEILRGSMAELRASLADLRSPLHPQESLGQALARIANEAGSRAAWNIYTDITDDGACLSGPISEALLRMSSEAITNVERHAHAHRLWVYLGRKARADGGVDVVLRVSDDGIGIVSTCPAACHPSGVSVGSDRLATGAHVACPTAAPGHYGILGMRERVSALGGQLTLTSREAEGGTVVEACLPLAS